MKKALFAALLLCFSMVLFVEAPVALESPFVETIEQVVQADMNLEVTVTPEVVLTEFRYSTLPVVAQDLAPPEIEANLDSNYILKQYRTHFTRTYLAYSLYNQLE